MISLTLHRAILLASLTTSTAAAQYRVAQVIPLVPEPDPGGDGFISTLSWGLNGHAAGTLETHGGWPSHILFHLNTDLGIDWALGNMPRARALEVANDGSIYHLSNELLLSKLDAGGELQWALQLFPDPYNITVCDRILVDGNGDVVAGYLSDVGMNVVRIRPDGTVVWSRTVSQDGGFFGLDSPMLALGSTGPLNMSPVFIGGHRNNWNPLPSPCILARFDVDGNIAWVRSYDLGPLTALFPHSAVRRSQDRLLVVGERSAPVQQPVILEISQANGELLEAVYTGGSISMGQDIHALADGSFVTVTAHHPAGEEGWAVTKRDAQGSPLWTASPLVGCIPADGYPSLSTDVDPSGHLIAESLIGTDVCVMSMSLTDAPTWACGAMLTTLIDHVLTVNSNPLGFVAGMPNEPIPTWYDPEPIDLETVPVCGYPSVGVPDPAVPALAVFPTPAADNVHIRSALLRSGSTAYHITDGLGRTARSGSVVSATGSVSVDVGDLDSGHYTIQLWQEGRALNARFIKE